MALYYVKEVQVSDGERGVFNPNMLADDIFPGMGAFLDGPFYSHTQSYEPEHMMDAIEHLEAVLEEDGPFDGILGFSQGAALTISYLHLCESRTIAPAIGFALFFSSVIPCSADEDFGDGLMGSICPLDESDEAGTRRHAVFKQILDDTIIPAQKNNAMMPNYDLAVYNSHDLTRAPRLMHAELTTGRISIPTIHVLGKKDAPYMRNMSETALGLCAESCLKKLEHSGSHHPPQKNVEVKATVRAIEWAMKCAKLQISPRMML